MAIPTSVNPGRRLTKLYMLARLPITSADTCMKCHGVRGIPPKTMKAKYPKIATFDPEFIAARTDDSVVKILAKGKGDDMKSFKDKLTPEQMMMLAKYVRTLASK